MFNVDLHVPIIERNLGNSLININRSVGQSDNEVYLNSKYTKVQKT